MKIKMTYTKVGGHCVSDFCIDNDFETDYNVLVH